MDWSGPWWLIVLAFAFALLIGTAIYSRRSRSSGLISVLAQMGFQPFSGPNPFSLEERKGFNLFSRGFGGRWVNLLTDNVDQPSVLVFDFGYRFGLRFVASVGYSQSVAAFSVQMTSLPDFQLTPATVLDRLAPRLGLQAIRFESRPQFGKKYWLRASNEISARAVFTDAFLDRLAAADSQAVWSIEKNGRWLLIYRHGKVFTPQALPTFVTTARTLADLFRTPH